jgi:hypothetical protein
VPLDHHRILEIGGDDQVSYADIMQEYDRQRGMRRVMIIVPMLTPRLSSLWLGLTTPLYARVGRKLVESLRNPTVVRDPSALAAFPIRPMGLRQSIERALSNEDRAFAVTRWSDATSSAGAVRTYAGVRLGTRLIDDRSIRVDRPAAAAFAPIRTIGGERGWYYADWLWRLRGFLDLLVGGAGMRRGRRHPTEIRLGDALDFWRVESYEPDRRLLLAAEMKLPGRAWLEFVVEPDGGGSIIHQTAIFDPAGLFGLVYWYAIYPLHVRVFAGMLRAIGRRVIDAKDASLGDAG